MTDYRYEYKQALRNGNEEEANKIYREHLREDTSSKEDENGDVEESEDERVLETPSSMNVSEAKDYADELDEEATKRFLEMEKEEKDRKSLVSYLE